MKALLTTLLLFSLLSLSTLQAALPGELDPTFATGSGINGEVYAIARQKDGRILIGGSFTSVQGVPRKSIARLMSNGALDLSFDPGSGADSNVLSLFLQPDGRILMAGSFLSYAGYSCVRLIRLLPDGAVDPSFQLTAGPDGQVAAIRADAHGKIYIGGSFNAFGAETRKGVARLNANGTLDSGFDPGEGTSGGDVYDLAIQSDGRVWIVGNFSSYSGVGISHVARILATGAFDSSYQPVLGPNQSVNALTLLPDGGAVLAGQFTEYDGIARAGVVRVRADGGMEASANTGAGISGASVQSVVSVTGGKWVISGAFTHFNGIQRKGLARLLPNGALDTSFADVNGATPFGYALSALPDGGVLVGGSENINGTGLDGIYRVKTNGVVDTAFNPTRRIGPLVRTTLTLPDGKIIVGGDFSTPAPQSRRNLARLNANGTTDLTFNSIGNGPDGSVNTLARQTDGKLLVGGFFNAYNSIPRANFTRLLANGSLDLTFNSGGSGPNAAVHAIAIQPDGKILIGGSFTAYNGTARPRIARLHADGSLDASFDPGSGADGVVSAIVVARDGSIYIGGSFSNYNGAPRGFIARLTTTGISHPSFTPGTGFSSSVSSLALDAAQRIVAGGFFISYQGQPARYIARIRSNGSLDTGFDTSSGFDAPVTAIAIQPDQRILAAGSFHNYQGQTVMGLIRLNPDASRDPVFSSGQGVDFVERIEIQPTGLALLAGQFLEYDGQSVFSLARVHTVLAPGGLSFRGITDTAGSKTESLLNLAGQFSLATGSTGIYSGKLVLGAESIGLTGAFDQRGLSQITGRRKDGSLLYLDLALTHTSGGVATITGTVRDAAASISVEAAAPAFTKSRTATQFAGVYHVALGIPGDTAFQDAVNPSAYGTLTATAAKTGSATVAGKLSDGTTVTGALSFNESGTLLLSPSLYGNRGLLNGRLILTPTYQDATRRRAVVASLVWKRPPNVPGGLYPAGFTTELINVDSSGLAPDLNTLVPATGSPNTTVQVNLAGGHFSVAGLNGTVTVNSQGQSMPLAVGSLSGLKLSINRATGTFNGSCTPPGAAGPVNFTGVIVNSAEGLGSCLVKVGTSTRISRISILKL